MVKEHIERMREDAKQQTRIGELQKDIRTKIIEDRRGQLLTQKQRDDIFKPISTPLNKLLSGFFSEVPSETGPSSFRPNFLTPSDLKQSLSAAVTEGIDLYEKYIKRVEATKKWIEDIKTVVISPKDVNLKKEFEEMEAEFDDLLNDLLAGTSASKPLDEGKAKETFVAAVLGTAKAIDDIIETDPSKAEELKEKSKFLEQQVKEVIRPSTPEPSIVSPPATPAGPTPKPPSPKPPTPPPPRQTFSDPPPPTSKKGVNQNEIEHFLKLSKHITNELIKDTAEDQLILSMPLDQRGATLSDDDTVTDAIQLSKENDKWYEDNYNRIVAFLIKEKEKFPTALDEPTISGFQKKLEMDRFKLEQRQRFEEIRQQPSSSSSSSSSKPAESADDIDALLADELNAEVKEFFNMSLHILNIVSLDPSIDLLESTKEKNKNKSFLGRINALQKNASLTAHQFKPDKAKWYRDNIQRLGPELLKSPSIKEHPLLISDAVLAEIVPVKGVEKPVLVPEASASSSVTGNGLVKSGAGMKSHPLIVDKDGMFGNLRIDMTSLKAVSPQLKAYTPTGSLIINKHADKDLLLLLTKPSIGNKRISDLSKTLFKEIVKLSGVTPMEGHPKAKLLHESCNGVMVIKNANEAMDKLELLIGSKEAGNTGVKNQINGVLDFLLKDGKLKQDEHKILFDQYVK
jgi:hypothetical protein